MSTSSGISVSQDLAEGYASAVLSKDIRFMLISIKDESLILNQTVNSQSDTLEGDLELLAPLLEDNVPMYILARLDQGESDWLFISYVPDTATVRNKMLYASTRSSLTKHLGDQRFKDSIFATSKSDLTPDAYAAHLRHTSAPQPMSLREAELASIKEAERNDPYIGSQTRHVTPIGKSLGLAWSDECREAVRKLGDEAVSGEDNLVIIGIDTTTETLILKGVTTTTIDDLPNTLPQTDPSFSFFAYTRTLDSTPKRDLIFIYTCPSSSPVKYRMIYSAAVNTTLAQTRDSTSDGLGLTVTKKTEASDPNDLDIAWLKSELDGDTKGTGANGLGDSTTPGIRAGEKFARPRGPARTKR